jgi:NADPH:quinone reductase-like Zn-dependent oxidoreductase
MGFLITSVLAGILLSRLVHQTFVPFTARLTRDDLSVLGELMKSGTVVPVIDRRYPLSEVREAMRYAEEGHVRGKVVLTV